MILIGIVIFFVIFIHMCDFGLMAKYLPISTYKSEMYLRTLADVWFAFKSAQNSLSFASGFAIVLSNIPPTLKSC